MSVTREFVPRLRPSCNPARLAFALVLLVASAASGAETTLVPHVFARAFEPGEVVRFDVGGAPGLASVKGRFGSADVSFVRGPGASSDAHWIGWGVIPLDAAAGPIDYRIDAKGADGRPVAGAGTVSVSAKSFPEQRLTVEPKFVNPGKAATARIEREKKLLAAIYASRSVMPPPAEAFVKPVPGDETSEFGTRRFFNGEARAPHPGLDLHAATGTPVLCAGPGRVVLAADLYYSGNTVIVDHGAGLFTIYAHLSKMNVKKDATVRAGDTIALSGATGRVTGPHLHWGARVGEAIFDPRALLDPKLFGAGSP